MNMKKQKIFFYSFLIIALSVLDACFDDAGTKLLLNNTAEVEIEEAGTSTGLDVSKSYQIK